MYPAPPNNSKQKALASFIVILAVVLVTVGVSAHHDQNVPTPTTPASQSAGSTLSDSTTSTDASSNPTASYKDGTYTSDSQYYVPPGQESIEVTLTIKNGVVTDSQVINSENDRESRAYQEAFVSSYKDKVVGKSLTSLQLAYLAGASDTTQAFNDAVSKIRTEAQA